MKSIDTSGQLCPAPLLLTRRGLKEANSGEKFQVITDSKVSFNNITRFLRDTGVEHTTEENNGRWLLTIIAGEHKQVQHDPEKYCTTSVPHFTRGDFVIAFSSDRMGEGDEALGQLLIANFIKAVKDLESLPSSMVFYNRGIMLGVDGTPSAEHLKEIESMGVKLLFCATCAGHYSCETNIRIGTLSNMFEIAQIMASAGNVIKP